MTFQASTKLFLGVVGAAAPALTAFVPGRLQKETAESSLALGSPEDKLSAEHSLYTSPEPKDLLC